MSNTAELSEISWTQVDTDTKTIHIGADTFPYLEAKNSAATVEHLQDARVGS